MKIDKDKVEMIMAEKCITHNALAKEMEVRPKALSKYLSNDVKSNRPYTVGRLAKALDCTIKDIIVTQES